MPTCLRSDARCPASVDCGQFNESVCRSYTDGVDGKKMLYLGRT